MLSVYCEHELCSRLEESWALAAFREERLRPR
jgi:hypothetical protein